MLVDLLNRLYENLMRESTGEEVEEFLGEIYARISAHFALEENVMREQHYDQYSAHKADHERLLDEIRDIMDGHYEMETSDKDRFAERLKSWFVNHFKTQDARLHGRLS